MKKIIKRAVAFGLFAASLFLVGCSCSGDTVLPSTEYLYARKPEGWQHIVTDSPYELGGKEVHRKTYEDGSYNDYYEQDYGNYPCIDGSTALMPLAWEMCWQFLPEYYAPETEGKTDGFAQSFCEFSGTHASYMNLIDRVEITRRYVDYSIAYGEGIRQTDFTKAPDVLFAGAPSAEELDYAAEKGVELDVTAVGYDAFVFITHKDNPVDSLTIRQVRDIYSGKITNWKDVGGKQKPVKAFQRPRGSGSQTGMEQLVMDGTPLMDPPTNLVIDPMSGLIDVIADYENNPGSIGYTYKYYLSNMHFSENVKMLKINGIAPTDDTVREKAYPFIAGGNAVIRKGEEGGAGGILRDWLLTGEGQKCVAQAGYVSAL